MNREKKAELRREILAARRALSAQAVDSASAEVLARLAASGLLDGRRTVALYAAADNEVRTRPLFERLLAEGKRLLLPRVRGRGPEIDFFEVREWERLTVSKLGIPEPADSGAPVPPEEFDLVIIPGVAFDARGGRLGYGMGCYDRALSRVRAEVPLVGVCYDLQLLDEVPVEAHDAPLSAVISQTGTYLPEKGRD
jgi:5-formyltetrahydrofolate cyclo-ligase